MTSHVPFFASEDEQRNRKCMVEKSFLCDVKDKKHSNRDTVQKAWEDMGKEMGHEGNY
jgi:hypothetical protein